MCACMTRQSTSEKCSDALSSYAWLKGLVSQLLKKSVKLKIIKFHRNLLEGFRVALKAFLGLVICLPNMHQLNYFEGKLRLFFG